MPRPKKNYSHPKLTSKLRSAIWVGKVDEVRKAIESLKNDPKKEVTLESLAKETKLPIEIVPALWKEAKREQ